MQGALETALQSGQCADGGYMQIANCVLRVFANLAARLFCVCGIQITRSYIYIMLHVGRSRQCEIRELYMP